MDSVPMRSTYTGIPTTAFQHQAPDLSLKTLDGVMKSTSYTVFDKTARKKPSGRMHRVVLQKLSPEPHIYKTEPVAAYVTGKREVAMDYRWAGMLTFDLTDSIPSYLAEDIFTLLDVPSLCHATEVSTRWNERINCSNYIWMKKYFDLNPSSGEGILRGTLPWKKMTIEAYLKKLCKQSWMQGKYSNIKCYHDLKHCAHMRPLTVKDWEEILQNELDR